jgi:putative Ca2+/H+ antiporter (TMEM165/GDT1 family)
MAMRNSRGVVLAGGLCALTIMTVLSVMLGLVVPQLISKETVSKAAFVLYTFFGCRLMYLAYKSDGAASMTGEIEEVEEKLEKGTSVSTRTRVARVLAKISSPVFIEAFVLIFLAEWGDRSQITTIALATHKNPYGVAIGGILGHTFCTSLAVAGGRIVAMKISPRTVSFVGGILFFGFALHALYFGAPGTEHM